MKTKYLIILTTWFFLVISSINGVQAQELTEINASEILEQIENGEDVYLENVRIIGELNLNNIELNSTFISPMGFFDNAQIDEYKKVESKIIIRKSIIENNIDFSKTLFRKELDFRGSSFLGNVDFEFSRFNSNVIFTEAKFNTATFSSAIFIEYVDFWGVNFQNGAWFEWAVFKSNTNFGYANLYGVLFNDAYFLGDYNFFWGSHFNGGMFYNTVFEGNVDFGNTDFVNAHFLSTTFKNNVLFRASIFKENASFEHVIFSADADFTWATFIDNADFSDTRFNELIFTNTHFLKKVSLGPDFKEISVSWSSLKNALVFDGATYMQLIKNFKEQELYNDADDVYYEYREHKRKNGGELWDYIVWGICGYGVKPLRPIGIGLAIIMVFSLIYWLCMSKSAALECSGVAFISGYNRDFVNNEFFTRFPSLETKISIISRGLLTGKRLIKFFMFSESLLGWLVLGLFIVTLANVMIRP